MIKTEKATHEEHWWYLCLHPLPDCTSWKHPNHSLRLASRAKYLEPYGPWYPTCPECRNMLNILSNTKSMRSLKKNLTLTFWTALFGVHSTSLLLNQGGPRRDKNGANCRTTDRENNVGLGNNACQSQDRLVGISLALVPWSQTCMHCYVESPMDPKEYEYLVREKGENNV